MKRLQIWIGVAFLTGCMLLATGCGNNWKLSDPTPISDTTTIAAGGTGGEGGTFTTTGGGGSCTAHMGECIPSNPDEFQGVAMYWIGDPAEVVPCPESAPFAGTTHWGDIQGAGPLQCAECLCSPAACALPEIMHASGALCAGANGAQSTSFDAPDGWTEGLCTDENAVPAGAQCGGGFCVQSLTIEAPRVEPCVPSAAAEVGAPAPSWGRVAQECKITPLPREDCIAGQACAPSPPPGFRLCVYRDGEDPDVACPDDYSDQRFVVYLGWKDGRGCSPCKCGDPVGADCLASIDLFTDGGCGTFLGSLPVSNAIPETCFDMPPGIGLGSKGGSFLVDKLGTCTPDPDGGKPTGEVTGTAPMTLCCKPATPTPPDPH